MDIKLLVFSRKLKAFRDSSHLFNGACLYIFLIPPIILIFSRYDLIFGGRTLNYKLFSFINSRFHILKVLLYLLGLHLVIIFEGTISALILPLCQLLVITWGEVLVMIGNGDHSAHTPFETSLKIYLGPVFIPRIWWDLVFHLVGQLYEEGIFIWTSRSFSIGQIWIFLILNLMEKTLYLQTWSEIIIFENTFFLELPLNYSMRQCGLIVLLIVL